MTAYTQIDEGKQKTEFSDFIEQLLCRKCCLVQLYTGSCCEIPVIYYLENVTDIDNIRYRRNICAINKDAKAPKDFRGTLLIIRSEASHSGYLRLYHAKANNKLLPYTYAVLPEERPAYSRVFLQKSEIPAGLASASSSTSKWLANFQTLSRDLVDAIWCPNWPQEADEWRFRERNNSWSLETAMNRIANNGCFLVAKPHQGSQLSSNEWRFSFSEAELILIHTWSDEQMYVYHILRLIKSDVVRKCSGKKMTSLTTYHFKTLMFWVCEEKPKEFWLFDSINSSIQELLITMIEWLISKQCQNYFMPGNNMLDHLPDDHDFDREVQFLTDSLKLVDQFASQNTFCDQREEFPLRIPNNVLFSVQLRARLAYIIDPSRPRRQMHAQYSDFEKSHLFRSHFINLFQSLTIHRRLALSADLDEKLNGLHEVEECFRRAAEKQVDGFTQINISPMDNFHVIFAKLLCKTIDSSSYSTESLKSNSKKAEPIPPRGNFTQRKLLCYSRTGLSQRSHIASILEMFFNVMNETMEKPTSFHTAAYEANFYWTISGEEINYRAHENYRKALAICNKNICLAHSILQSLTYAVCFGRQSLPIVISNIWSGIFDKYIQILIGFLSVVKATTSRMLNSIYNMSDSNMNFSILVHIHAVDFLEYIRYQCKLHLRKFFMLDDSFTNGMHNDVSKLFLYTAARISIQAIRTILLTSTIHGCV